MRFKRILTGILVAGLAGLEPAHALDLGWLTGDTNLGVAGDVQLRLRGVGVIPDPSAKILVGGSAIGGVTKITDSMIPEADISYFLTDHLAVEAIAAVTKHSVSNSVAGAIGTVSLLPPTVTAQYHFAPEGWIRPYLGAGINYTVFYDARSPLPNIHYRNTFGWALQAGADFPIEGQPYFLNVDAKKLFLNTSLKAADGAVRAHADINPWLVGAGVGVRF
jgi:outer membrane protein